jgi:hypothetical protein
MRRLKTLGGTGSCHFIAQVRFQGEKSEIHAQRSDQHICKPGDNCGRFPYRPRRREDEGFQGFIGGNSAYRQIKRITNLMSLNVDLS